MAIITFTTDWLKDDYYTPALRGNVLNKCSNVQIVPISTKVESFNLHEASFIVKNSFEYFPEGTIHIIGVNLESEMKTRYLLISYKNHWFLGADNGIFGLIFEESPDAIYQIDENKYYAKKLNTFPELTLSSVACDLINGIKPDSFATKIEKYVKKIDLMPAIEESIIVGQVIYIDSYQNAITNITRALFDRVGKNRAFTIYVKSKRDKIEKINKSYGEGTDGELIAIFNSCNLLEIAMCNANAAGLFGLDTDSSIRINFHEPKNTETENKMEMY